MASDENLLESVGEKIALLVAPLSPVAKLHAFSEIVAAIAKAADIDRESFLSTLGAYYDGAPHPWFWSSESSRFVDAHWRFACPSCGSSDLTHDEERRIVRCNACATGGAKHAFVEPTER